MEELYKKYSKLIYKYFYSLTKNSFLSEELVQETFYSAIKNSNNLSKDSNVQAWLYKIAKNKWLDYLRKKKKENTVSLEEQVYSPIFENLIENDFIEKNELLDFYKKIHKLNETTREVIYLRIKSDLSFKEIAAILNKSEEWTRVTFYRGKLKLMEDFKNENK